jgi:tetratricopeptide (TPR) repeat protein
VAIIAAGCGSSEQSGAQHLATAQALFAEGDYVRAGIEAKNAAQIEPMNVEARFLLALIAEKEEKYAEAFGHLQIAADAGPDNVEVQVKLGDVYLLANMVEEAEAQAEAMMALAPDDPSVRVLNARVHVRKNEREPAIAEIEAALAIDPEYVEAILLQVAAYAETDREKSLEILDEAIDRLDRVKNRVLRRTRALMAAQDERYDDVEAEWRGLIADYPDDSAYRFALTRFFILTDRPEDAEKELREIIALDPSNIDKRLELIRLMRQTNRPDAMEATLLEFIDEFPDALQLRLVLAEHYSGNDQADEALEQYRQISELAPLTAAGFEARYYIAIDKIRNGDLDQGRALIDAMLADDPGNADALLARATLLFDEEAFEEALADLRVVLRNQPDAVRGLYLTARAHYVNGDRVLAKDAYRKLLAVDPAHPAGGNEMAALLSADGEQAAAEAVLRTLLEADPGNGDAANRLVELLMEQGKLDTAEQEARRMVSIDETGRGDVALGRVLQAAQRYDEAIEAYALAVDKSPSDSLALEGMVRCWIAADKVDDAIEYLQQHTQSYPEQMPAKFLLGTMYARTEQYSRAIALYEEVMAVTEPAVMLYSALAIAYPDDVDARIKVLERGLAEIPDDRDLAFSLAGEYQTAGRIDEAMALYEDLLSVDPDRPVVANNLAGLLLDFRSDEASFKRALDLVTRFSRSDRPAFLDTLGWAYYRVGNYDQAVVFLERAVVAAGEMPELRYHLGMTYLALDNELGARQELNQAIVLAQEQAQDGFTGIEDARATLEALQEG